MIPWWGVVLIALGGAFVGAFVGVLALALVTAAKWPRP